MRKAKSILLLAPEEMTASAMSLRAYVWGYRITTVLEADDVSAELQQDHHDLVILMPQPDAKTWTRFHLAAVSAEHFQANRGGMVRIYDPANFLESAKEVALGVSRIFGVNENLKESIRLAMVRKRGPRAPVPSIYVPQGKAA